MTRSIGEYFVSMDSQIRSDIASDFCKKKGKLSKKDKKIIHPLEWGGGGWMLEDMKKLAPTAMSMADWGFETEMFDNVNCCYILVVILVNFPVSATMRKERQKSKMVPKVIR